MRILRVVIALIMMVALLYIARTNSKGQPHEFSHTENGYSFLYTNVPSGQLHSSVDIPVTIAGDFSDSAAVYFRYKPTPDNLDEYEAKRMTAENVETGLFTVNIPTGGIGGRFYYYFEVRDYTGNLLARFTEDDMATPFVLKFEGKVPLAVLLGHLFFIFATVFSITMATLHAIPLIKGNGVVKPVAFWMLLSVVFCFIGGYPIGFGMNWYAFGTVWEGVPFGTDATDNKTQLLFVYIVFALLTMLGSLRGKKDKNLYSDNTIGWITIGAFAVMWFIYLIPHSIQFSKELTYTVCYSYIGVIALIYIVSKLFNKRAMLTSG